MHLIEKIESRQRTGNSPFGNGALGGSMTTTSDVNAWANLQYGHSVVDVRRQSKGSINQQGRFQGDLIGIEAEVKDESRFPEKWGFFAFNGSAKSAKSLPSSTTDCQSRHSQNGAVDNTFVQFYPTLLEVAKQKGTLKAAQPASK